MNTKRMFLGKDRVSESVEFGEWVFPDRFDYEQYFLSKGIIQTPAELWEHDELVSSVHQHWHTKGQNGCVFARALATHPEKYGWQVQVVNLPASEIGEAETINRIDSCLEDAIQFPNCGLISFLFPQVVTAEHLADLLQGLLKSANILLDRTTQINEFVTLALRIPINEEVLSWPLGFGPFSFLPNTRQSPVTELAIRTKPKPEALFEKLTPDRQAAHLADVPLQASGEVYHTFWDATQKRTLTILNGSNREFAKARVTFTLPQSVWC